MILRVFVLAVMAGGAIWAYRDFRRGLQAALVLVIFEGAIRKWIVPGAADYVYFGKDVVLLGVYGGFLSARSRRALRPAVPAVIQGALLASAVLGLLQIFNPHLPNPLVGILGFKAHFLNVPLLWVVPAAFADDRAVYRFLRRYLWLAIPVGLLAAAQFVSPATSRINTYAPRAGSIAMAPAGAITFGSSTQVRVTGTFSFISGFTTYLLVAALLALAFLALGRWRWRGNLVVYTALGLTLGGMLMSGSRGPVLLLALLLPLYWMLGVAREGGLPAFGRFLLGAAVVAALVNFVGADAVSAFWGRASGGGSDVVSRMIGPVVTPLRVAGEVGIFGYGIGSSHQTAEALAKGVFPYSWLEGHQYEDEPSRIMVELGLIGWFFSTLVRASLIVVALREVFRLRSSFHRVIATSCALLFLAHFLGGVVFNITGGVYYWFFAGLLMLVRKLDREQTIARWEAARMATERAPLADGRRQPALAR